MSAATSGWLVRRSDSVHPVHSWKWSQMTEGFLPFAMSSAIASPAHAGRPTAAAAVVQIFRKSRRDGEEGPATEVGCGIAPPSRGHPRTGAMRAPFSNAHIDPHHA